MARGKPVHRPELMNDEDRSIISLYGSEYRGIAQYYLLAGDVWRLNRLRWVMATSLLKTLAGKYDSSVSKIARKYAATTDTPHWPRKCLQVSVDRGEGREPLVATFGGIPLRRQKAAVLIDREPARDAARGSELIRRLQFLQEDLKLELSETKTLITHARTRAARFLGYEITVGHDNQRLTAGRRSANGRIRLHVPTDLIKAKCARHMRGGKPERRTGLMNEQDHAIISRYGAEYRGIVQYYLLASDVWRLNRLHWVMLTSLLKTLAGKHGSSVSKMARKYAATIETPHGPRQCMQVRVEHDEGRKPLVATFGGIPLRRQKNAVLIDRQPVREPARGSELIRRLQAGRCELCDQTTTVQVHQIRNLAVLHRPGQPQLEWMQAMAKRRRKTLIVCATCHAKIHHEQPTTITT